MKAIYSEDEHMVLRKSHQNPDVIAIYKEFLDKPNSHKSHDCSILTMWNATTFRTDLNLPKDDPSSRAVHATAFRMQRLFACNGSNNFWMLMRELARSHDLWEYPNQTAEKTLYLTKFQM